MLKKKTPETFEADLTIISIGEKIKLKVVYNNVDPVKVDEENKDKKVTQNDLLRTVVNSWESEYDLHSDADLAQLERDRPSLIWAVIQGFYQGRVAALQKN